MHCPNCGHRNAQEWVRCSVTSCAQVCCYECAVFEQYPDTRQYLPFCCRSHVTPAPPVMHYRHAVQVVSPEPPLVLPRATRDPQDIRRWITKSGLT